MAESVPHPDDRPGTPLAPSRTLRVRRAVLICSVVAVVATVTLVGALGFGGGKDKHPGVPSRAGSFVPVTRATVTERTKVDGQLGYGAEVPLLVKATGTVTWLPEQGTLVERGGVLLRVNDRPVVLLYGSLPMYRDLRPASRDSGRHQEADQGAGKERQDGAAGAAAGSSPAPGGAEGGASSTGAGALGEVKGSDVLQFQTNLAALGFTGFAVDGMFTAGTAQAVRRWQKSLGLPQTGTVGVGDVFYSAGKVRIGHAGVRLGAPVGENALTYTGTARNVVVNASAADASWAVRGAPVRVQLPDGASVRGEVESVGKQVTAPEKGEGGSGQVPTTVPVSVTIRDQKSLGRLESGPVTVEYVGREAKGVLTVPVAALVALAEGGHGLETADGTFVAVKTGLFADGRVEVSGPSVREGLKVRVPE
ncbi:peptidoglycan-binding protein [Streptomyces sp. UNOB3_S3]|uniref:peptidoglycan-binding protein n=1 Tax=Streptomyces sp. UNOB3_S3 TaxID=2871682 RepID=UPI001E3CED78|nr:peptidoglycan-binding protein [Streptomyces sp. UNOB3_S3]